MVSPTTKRVFSFILDKHLAENKLYHSSCNGVLGPLGILDDYANLIRASFFLYEVEGDNKKLAKEITNSISIPTIGIGSSNNCDGQVLVTDDVLGLTDSKIRFVKKFTDINYKSSSTEMETPN